MKTFVWISRFLLVIAALMATTLKARGPRRDVEKPRRKRPLTDREQAMYNRLATTLPELVVMPQVAMSALLTAKSRTTRNTFDRKVIDFVICDKAFQVLAVIELDDRSHDARRAHDETRDAMLVGAGYKVIRYTNVPDVAEVARDLKPSPVRPTQQIEPSLEPRESASTRAAMTPRSVQAERDTAAS